MKSKFDKILKIKSKKDLLKSNGKIKYSLNKPIINDNYLFHILININKIEYLDNFKYPVFEFNEDNLDGIMLAAKNQSYETLIYLLKKFPDYIYNTNNQDNTWLHYLDLDLIKKIIFMKKLNFIDWKRLLYSKNLNNIYPIGYIFMDEDYKFIIKIIKEYFENKEDMNFLIFLFSNEFLSNSNYINILKLLIKKKVNFNTTKNLDTNLIWPLITKKNDKILDLLYQYKTKENQGIYGFFPHANGSHSIYFLLNTYKKFNLNEAWLKKFYKKFKKFLDIKDNNVYNDSFILSLLNYRLLDNIGSNYIEKDIFKTLSDNQFNNINIYNDTILHILVQLDYNKYHKFLKNRKIINHKNKDGLYPIDLTTDKKWIKLLKKKKFTKPEKFNLNIIQAKSAFSTVFKAYIADLGLNYYLLEKIYPKLYIPKTKVKTLIQNLNYDAVEVPDNIFLRYHDFAWVIVWNSKDSYYIHPHLNMLIMAAYNSKKYEFASVFVSYRNKSGGLHALPILYNFNKKIIERWDSFGYSPIFNSIDKVLEKELTKDTIFKYKGLDKTQFKVGIQEMSLENRNNNIKRGDFGGFCAAWTIWFIEHKIKNPKIDTKKLINKMLQKILVTSQNKYKNYGIIISYIRNYSNYLQKRIQDLFDIQKWDYDDYTNESVSIETDIKIYNFLMKLL